MTDEENAVGEDQRQATGPFDIIGDVHGCADELIALLKVLGYKVSFYEAGGRRRVRVKTPGHRQAVFVGDLVDRGPASPDVLRIVMTMVEAGDAWCVPGNHDNKFMRWLMGRPVKLTHGLDATVSQISAEPEEFRSEVLRFVERLPSYLWLDGGRLIVAHAGIRADMIGRTGDWVHRFCLYGDTDSEKDEFGLTLRYHWALDYRGEAAIVYGHTPVLEADWINDTLCLDTGAVFGGKLTALRWPEREIVSVPSQRAYAELRRPFGHPPPRPGGGLR